MGSGEGLASRRQHRAKGGSAAGGAEMVGSGLAVCTLLWATTGVSGTYVTQISGGNALTLPAQRHLVRMAPGGDKPAAWLLALQKGGRDSQWLVFLRSDDEGVTWNGDWPADTEAQVFVVRFA
ncbi:MAG: hypothetical protein HY901_28425 [Deltaproteobacteria bacterium]|nr:hypothetical protein [Deltaproteobacteria bacterium]